MLKNLKVRMNQFDGDVDLIGKPHENMVYEIDMINKSIVCKGVWKDIGHPEV